MKRSGDGALLIYIMNIIFVSYSNPNDRKAWSGTTFEIYHSLEKSINNILNVQLESRSFKIFKLVVQKASHLFRYPIIDFNTTIFGSRIYGRILDRKIRHLPIKPDEIDFIVIPAGASVAAYSKYGAKIVLINDATFDSMKNYYYNTTHTKIINNAETIDQKALDNAGLVILSSQWAVNSVIGHYAEPKSKVHLLRFGANLPDLNTIQLSRSIEGKKVVYLLLVGVSWVRKGVPTAIETVHILNEQQNDKVFRLIIIGFDKPEGWNDDQVSFEGKLYKDNDNDLSRLVSAYERADIFFLPTKAEAAGIVFCEAAMFSLPVVTYDTGGSNTE